MDGQQMFAVVVSGVTKKGVITVPPIFGSA